MGEFSSSIKPAVQARVLQLPLQEVVDLASTIAVGPITVVAGGSVLAAGVEINQTQYYSLYGLIF